MYVFLIRLVCSSLFSFDLGNVLDLLHMASQTKTALLYSIQEDKNPTESLQLEKGKGRQKRPEVAMVASQSPLACSTHEFERGTQIKGKVKRVMAAGMRTKKSVLHTVANSVLPAADVTSDFLTFLELLEHGDIGWAAAVLFFIFVPFFFKMGEFLVDLCRGKVKVNNVVSLFLHLPFVAPIVQLSLGLRILLIDPTKPENLWSIEKVAKIAALGSMYEAFLESGPQLQLQLHIILSTGRPTKTQLFSIVLSTLSLTLASCRAFYVQRSRELSDPQPNIHMILRVFPYMFIQVTCVTLKYSLSSA